MIFGDAFVASTACPLAFSAFTVLPGLGRPPQASPTQLIGQQTSAATDETAEGDPTDPIAGASESTAAPSALGLIAGATGMVTSCFTAITTFVGFVATPVWGLRKERRESRHANLKGKLREIELECRKLERVRLRRQHSASDQDSRSEPLGLLTKHCIEPPEPIPMLAKVYSCAVIGLDGGIVEVDTSNGLPSFVDAGSDSQYGSPVYGKASEAG